MYVEIDDGIAPFPCDSMAFLFYSEENVCTGLDIATNIHNGLLLINDNKVLPLFQSLILSINFIHL